MPGTAFATSMTETLPARSFVTAMRVPSGVHGTLKGCLPPFGSSLPANTRRISASGHVAIAFR